MSRRDLKLAHILWLSLAVGLAFRLCSAYFVYGPQALDDYKHGILPAYQWAMGEAIQLPDYRSFFLTWLLGWPIYVLNYFHIDQAISQVRVVYLELALISLLAWSGLRLYAQTFASRRFALYTMVLLAIYPLMPFISTRAFGEAVALPLVLAGMTLAEAGRRGNSRQIGLFCVGLFLLGLAAFFRFQVGLLYLVYTAIFLFRKEWRFLGFSLLLGSLLLLMQAGVDLLSGRAIFSTLQEYVLVNEGGAAQYGVSPWYNTWVMVLALTLFPLSLGFVRELSWAWQRHWRLILPLLVFILVHSLMPHKEERFMYPIVGLVLLLMSEVLAKARKRRFTRLIYKPFLGLICVVGLSITCFNNTQVGEIEPIAEINMRFPQVVLIDKKSLLSQSRIKDFFVRPPSAIVTTTDSLTANLIDHTIEQQPVWQAVGLLTADLEVKTELEQVANSMTAKTNCGPIFTASNWTDALIYRMNPRHNQRRRPTWYVVCERKI